jgi:hypothetical protein
MKTSDHQKVMERFLEHGEDNVFTKQFMREVAIAHPSVFNKVCDRMVLSPLSPFRTIWKERVIACLRDKNKLEAIKYLRQYSSDHPSMFNGQMLSLVDAKNIVESMNDTKTLGV